MAGRVLDLALHLLDRQVVDTDGNPVGKVDDV
jgi:sporulation protein YlmC with PRC-barrel domain